MGSCPESCWLVLLARFLFLRWKEKEKETWYNFLLARLPFVVAMVESGSSVYMHLAQEPP